MEPAGAEAEAWLKTTAAKWKECRSRQPRSISSELQVWVHQLVGQYVIISDADRRMAAQTPHLGDPDRDAGHGNPRPDPDRSGPATVIIVNGMPYLFDFGPGIIRRAVAAYNRGVLAIGPAAVNLRTVFVTHLHADHTAGYPDLILTPWILGPKGPGRRLRPQGPRGYDSACVERMEGGYRQSSQWHRQTSCLRVRGQCARN